MVEFVCSERKSAVFRLRLGLIVVVVNWFHYMPCYFPLQGYLVEDSSGKKSFKFSNTRSKMFQEGVPFSSDDGGLAVPCGRCIGCRLERSRQWAMRCMHEASLHEQNCFITLTYDDDHLPKDMSLNKRHFQLFMKRLREKTGSKIRYYHCGEYGDLLGRPHYHSILFGYDFPDLEICKVVNGHRLYTSLFLSSVWTYGFSTVGSVTFDSAAYVARYCMKKVVGRDAEEHYRYISPEGEVFQREPEYATMSRRPGIGKGWFERFSGDAYPSDYLIMNGAKSKPPRFYDNQFELIDPSGFADVKNRRKSRAGVKSSDNTQARLVVKEKVKRSSINKLKRSLEV